MRSLVFVLCLASCVNSASEICDDGRVCPRDTVCDDKHQQCVTPDQIAQCDGQPDGTPCTLTTGVAACDQGVCLTAVCGDGRIEPGELCDDGNLTDGDGCSADCRSTEVCGNGLIDTITGEACDDGNQLDHDGCSSACEIETANWVQLVDPGQRINMKAVYDYGRGKVVMWGGNKPSTPATAAGAPDDSTAEWAGVWRSAIPTASPPWRSRFAMAYEGALQRTIVFGGTTDGTQSLGDMWEWNGDTWTQGPNGPTLIGASMVYDSKRKRLVLYGGVTDGVSGVAVADTWQFDGVAWTKLSPSKSPPALADAGLVYDPQRDVVVLYGGLKLGFDSYELWEFDGTTWTDHTDPLNMTGPNAVGKHAMAYSTTLHATVVYGGFLAAATNAMWTWNGATWAKYAPATPPARGAATLVADDHGRMLLFGGRTASSATAYLADTWQFSGTWAQLVAPSARYEIAMTDVLDQTKVVMFGGKNTSNVVNAETWELSAAGWKLFPDGPALNDSPPTTELAAMTYDAGHQQVVLFGGASNNGTVLDNTTWLRTGTTWTPTKPAGSPTGRFGQGLSYDAVHGNVVMFGGLDLSATPLADTWIWNGAAWTQVTPLHAPSARHSYAMAYDPIHQRVVLFGGFTNVGNQTFNDTWTWDGTDWTDVTPAVDKPSPRSQSRLVWNPARRSLNLVGGTIAGFDLFETWEWTGAAWHRLTQITKPPGRVFGGAFSSLDGSGIAVFGGLTTNLTAILGDLWTLRTDGPRGSDTCDGPVDADGDGLTGCTDPDCWRVCQPDCSPGTSCIAALPHCGDGVCQGIETCHSCPMDCTCTPVCGDFICDSGESCPGDCP